jgi:hypothetical protein
MEFRLLFEGQVKPRQRASLADIHDIRKQLHPQIKKLWEHPPLDECREWLRLPTSDGDYAVYEERGSKIYAPLVTKRTDLLGELDIIFLRQQAKGQLIGDIDNRLKTLFDALRVPSLAEVRTLGATTAIDENPLYCLFQDDSLITRLNIETDRLLRPTQNKYELVSLIKVLVRPSKLTVGNSSIG